MRDIEALLKAGNQAQREKLEENGYKESWQDMTFQEIANLIDEEYDEVFVEMGICDTDYRLLRRECADLKNSLNFMICLCDKELEANNG